MIRYLFWAAHALVAALAVAFNTWFFGWPPLGRTEPQHETRGGARHVARPDVLPGRQDCGAKSLYVICKAAGKSCNIAHLRRLTNTTSDGTSMLDLKNAVTSLGFEVEAYELPFAELHEVLSIPGHYAILHARTDHFFAAVGVSGELVRVLDPAIGIDDVGERELVASRYRWTGKALLLKPR